jgi:RimJ/RimL family protein N-acetyltransferase
MVKQWPDQMRILRAARLTLVPTTAADVALFMGLNSDPEVMRYLLGRASTEEETRAEWAERLGERTDASRGLGYWTGYVDHVFVGWWSASSFASDPSQAGLGYRLIRDAWGQGLATEGGAAMIDHAFTIPGIERVVASTMAVNAGSRRVLEKLGLTQVRTVVEQWDDPIPGWEQGEVHYELERPS